jgi:hypothetical protein
VELNRARRSLPADLPPELLAVVGLLCVAGLFTGVPVLRALPDAFKLISDGGLWDSFGLLVLVLLAELGLFAVACFLLAWQVSQGDPVARVVTVVVSGSLAFGLLLGNGLDDGSATVTLLCSIAVVVCLTVPPRAREFFADRAPGPAPTPVVAAEALLVMLSAILLAVGVAYLPVMSVKAKYALVGLAMIGIAVAGFRGRRRLRTGEPAARTLVSGLMAGAAVAILLGGDGSLTGALFIPLGVAVAIVGLLWIPQESQSLFNAGRSMDIDAADGDEAFADYAEPAPAPPGSSSVRMTSARLPLPPSFAVDDDYPEPPPPPRPPADRVPTPPFAPGPAPSPYATGSAPSPYAPTPAPARTSAARPAPAYPTPTPPSARTAPSPAPVPAPPPPASVATRPPATPPGWLLEAPPAGFWPPERRRADPRRYEIIHVVASATDELEVAPDLGIRFDTTSWFPVLEGREQVRGAYLVSMAMFDEGATGAAFRGTSTLLVTSARLVGVCAKGESGAGPLGAGTGRVAVWRVLLDQIDWVRVEGSAEGGHLALKGWDSERPWALLAKPRAAVEGAFRPSPLADLAELVNRAKHTGA